jgi:capsular polysaccharide transport system permease protein
MIFNRYLSTIVELQERCYLLFMTDVKSPSPLGSHLEEDEVSQLREINTPFATSRSVFALMLREMTTSYGRSPGGYIWAILEPAAGITLLTAVFSAGFRSPPLGASFPLFYATGILMFIMYSEISGKLSQTLYFSRALLEYPRVTFIDALMARLILSTLTQFMVHFVVFMGVIVLFAGDVAIDFAKVTNAYFMLISLSIGIGVVNSFLIVAYPVWQSMWAVVNRPLFIISCIFFLFEAIPEPYSSLLWFNPLVHPIGTMRDAFYPYYNPEYVTPEYPLFIGAVCLLVGLFLLNRYHRDILDK